jgi:peptidoglycan/xylan/chitin deacetylase (PgdA/CDA1 family)
MRIVRKALSIPSNLPGYLAALRKMRSKGAVIVMYHGVSDRPLQVRNWCFLDVQEFENQARFLAENYRVMPLAELVERMQSGKPLPAHAACITFDDGFRNVATNASPILKKYQLPATIFIVTSSAENRQPAWPDKLYFAISKTERNEIEFKKKTYPLGSPDKRATTYKSIVSQLKELSKNECDDLFCGLLSVLGNCEIPEESEVASMNWDEITNLSGEGLFSFGSHTHTHPILSACPLETQRQELEKSRDILRAHGLSSRLFAYPNGRAGDFSEGTKQLLCDLGYSCALSTVHGINKRGQDMYALRRVGVGDSTEGKGFEFLALGI